MNVIKQSIAYKTEFQIRNEEKKIRNNHQNKHRYERNEIFSNGQGRKK